MTTLSCPNAVLVKIIIANQVAESNIKQEGIATFQVATSSCGRVKLINLEGSGSRVTQRSGAVAMSADMTAIPPSAA